MRAPHHDDELVRYVLGLLSDEARERLDEASIADDAVAARLRAAETNLIDDYVRGQLTGPTLERFESYYLSSPRRRERVRAAADFLGAVDRAVERPAPAAWTARLRSIGVARLAAAALVILAGGGIALHSVRPRIQLARATPEGGAAARQPPDTPSPSPPRAAASTPAASPEAIVAVVLPAPTRSLVPIPELVVPAGVNRVRFELQLEATDFASYRVSLQDPATDRVRWRSEWIVPGTSAAQASVSVVVPADLLAPRHYSLELTGRGAGGRPEAIGIYSVRVLRP